MASKRNSSDYARARLETLRDQELYRTLKKVVVNGPTATVEGRDVVHLCSNDYLGLSRDARVVRQMKKAIQSVSQCSSRLIAGNHPLLMELEQKLAEHRKTRAALVYPTGYSANLGLVSSIADKNSTIFSDELNHASIIDACRLSGATVRVFGHNSVSQMAEMMRQTRGRKIVITEGVFSMDGDVSKLEEICAIAEEHDAITVVDDAHGDFVFGPDFSGVPAMLKAKVDIHISSMSKALGCFGGYVALSEPTRELLINTSRQFIYTSALPDHLCAAAISAIPPAKRGHLQAKLQRNIRRFRESMEKAGFVLGASSSQIIPVIIGSEKLSVEFSDELLRAGVFAQAIRYPTVKKGMARLRVSLTAMHSLAHIDLATEAFRTVGAKMKII
ncbi:MAG TPA: aminotransferase class I/II-fold pyridoxal phosphate-dependent enzyme [Nitrososphaera sp.]